MTCYYLSGPMRGKPEHNYPAFLACEESLYAHFNTVGGLDDVEVINPARNFGGDQQRQQSEYMQADLSAVLRADVIVLLPGWTASEGAARETLLGQWTGKRFMLANEIEDWAGSGVGWRFTDIEALPAKAPSPRASMLAEAEALVTGDRNSTYGPPTQDFSRTANALNAYGYSGPGGRPLEGHDVAILMMALKLSRLMWTPDKRDSWVDIAGYAACGYECAAEEAGRKREALT